MYHVKNDKRCIRSAESIMNALEQLMAKKAFLDITITDIQKTAGIGRSTFYRLFDTIDDVVTYMVDREFEEIVRGYSTMSIRDFTIDCLSGVIERGYSDRNPLIRKIRARHPVSKREPPQISRRSGGG